MEAPRKPWITLIPSTSMATLSPDARIRQASQTCPYHGPPLKKQRPASSTVRSDLTTEAKSTTILLRNPETQQVHQGPLPGPHESHAELEADAEVRGLLGLQGRHEDDSVGFEEIPGHGGLRPPPTPSPHKFPTSVSQWPEIDPGLQLTKLEAGDSPAGVHRPEGGVGHNYLIGPCGLGQPAQGDQEEGITGGRRRKVREQVELDQHSLPSTDDPMEHSNEVCRPSDVRLKGRFARTREGRLFP